MGRRALKLQSFSQVRDEIRALAAGPYRRRGTWSLGQVCDHLSIVMNGSLDGFGFVAPRVVRMGSRPALWWMVKRWWMPGGVKAPKQFVPAEGVSVDDQAGVEKLLAVITRYEAHTGPLHPSPLFGNLSRLKWDQLHLIHASHHLSFIEPTSGT